MRNWNHQYFARNLLVCQIFLNVSISGNMILSVWKFTLRAKTSPVDETRGSGSLKMRTVSHTLRLKMSLTSLRGAFLFTQRLITEVKTTFRLNPLFLHVTFNLVYERYFFRFSSNFFSLFRNTTLGKILCKW